VSDEKLLDVEGYAESPLFEERERVALAYAEAMTITSEEVSDELFDRLKDEYSDEEIIELTCTIAFENFLSKFHRALRVESQGFCPIGRPR
jgi:alkylhydroperoxidase family enzyme